MTSLNEKEIDELADGIYMRKDQILVYREIPIITIESLDVYFEKMGVLLEGKQDINMILDLTETIRPGARIREYIKKRFAKYIPQIKHVAVFTGKNLLINIALKFVFAGINFNSFSIHKTEEEALRRIKERHA